jgi:hypothetical protein
MTEATSIFEATVHTEPEESLLTSSSNRPARSLISSMFCPRQSYAQRRVPAKPHRLKRTRRRFSTDLHEETTDKKTKKLNFFQVKTKVCRSTNPPARASPGSASIVRWESCCGKTGRQDGTAVICMKGQASVFIDIRKSRRFCS